MVIISGSRPYVSTAVTKETQMGFGIIVKKSEDANLLKDLYNKIYNALNTILGNYISGEINDEYYKQSNISLVSQKISVLKTSDNTYYNGIINILLDSITSIKYGYNYYKENVILTENLAKCREEMSILNDFEKLKEYLISLYQQIILFETDSSLSVSASLKKEYVIYINLYGIPNELVFDENKLSEIIYLINLGVF